MKHSIKKYTAANKQRAANEIIMLRTNPQFISRAFLIVEGVDDKLVFDNLIDAEKCRIEFAEGRENVIASLSVLEKRNIKGVLGVIDADFWILDGRIIPSQNLHLTDTHDLESMLLDSPALEKVLRQLFLKGKAVEDVKAVTKSIRAILYKIGATIGYLRWFCSQNKLPLGFTRLDFYTFVDAQQLLVNLPELIKRAKNTSQVCPMPDAEIQSNVELLKKSNKNPILHVCHGKDLIAILWVILPTVVKKELNLDISKKMAKYGPGGSNGKELDEGLRLAYETRYFYHTKLYASIKKWEEANTPYTILESVS